jgi:peptidyl-tRNA hydrolase, PTH1 family
MAFGPPPTISAPISDDLADLIGAVAAEAEWLAKGDDVRFMNDVAMRLNED